MELILYRTLDNANVINKVLTDPVTVNITLKNDVNIINPEIVLSGDFRGYNYAHIPELNRFYFIESFEQINLRFGKLFMSCDVLETYKADILKQLDHLTQQQRRCLSIVASEIAKANDKEPVNM